MAQSTQDMTVAVVGIGNLLMKDDGLGVHAVQALGQEDPRPSALLIDGGTDPWSALTAAERCRALLVLDAVKGGKEPAEFHRLSPEELDAGSDAAMSMHSLTLLDLLRYETLLGRRFDHVRVFGMEPHTVDYGIGLSEPCRQRLPAFLRMVRREIADMRERLITDQGGQ